MNHTDTDIHILILSRDKENALVLSNALYATALKIRSIKTAATLAAAEKSFKKKKPSIIFLDIGESSGITAFDSVAAGNRSTPVIVITDKKNTQFAYTLLEKGATDFFKKVKKYDPQVLEKSVRFSIENKITAESLRLSNERYELVSKATNDMVWDWDLLNNRVFRSADGWDKVFGKTNNNESVHADSWWDRVHPEDKKHSNQILENVLHDNSIQYFEIECRMMRNDSSYATVVDRGYAIRNEAGDVTRLVGATQDITGKKAADEKLAEERRMMQDEITRAVITAQEQEREALGKELHDNINQILATTKLYIEYALTNDEMRIGLLTSAKDFIESAVAEIRKLSKSLMPPSLGEVGLLMALDELANSIRPVSSFSIATDWDGVKEQDLSEGLKLTVFRIIQEQLANISRHAKATKVMIALRQKSGKLMVIVKDNGKGFDTKEKVTGVGLKNILSRAQLHNGKLEITAAKGKGCTISILFKL